MTAQASPYAYQIRRGLVGGIDAGHIVVASLDGFEAVAIRSGERKEKVCRLNPRAGYVHEAMGLPWKSRLRLCEGEATPWRGLETLDIGSLHGNLDRSSQPACRDHWIG